MRIANEGTWYVDIMDYDTVWFRYVKRSAMPGPLEFWLCASDFNPFNILIAQPMTKERCEVIPRAAPSSGADTGSAANMPIVQTFG